MKHIITCSNYKCKYNGEGNRCTLKTIAINDVGTCASSILSQYYIPTVKKIDTSSIDEYPNCIC